MSPRLIAVAAALFAGLLLVSGCSGLAQGSSDPWPPSTTGRPVFYYFGDPG
jgi:hypothetical protein